MCLALCHTALRVTLVQGLWVEHTSGEGDRERDLIHLYNEVEEKVCFQTLQTNVVRERGICQTLTDGRCTRYAKTTQIVTMKAYCIRIFSIGFGHSIKDIGNFSEGRGQKILEICRLTEVKKCRHGGRVEGEGVSKFPRKLLMSFIADISSYVPRLWAIKSWEARYFLNNCGKNLV